MSGSALVLLVLAAVSGVLGLALPPLCFVGLILAIIGALVQSNHSRAVKRAEEEARTAAIVAAVQKGQQPPQL